MATREKEEEEEKEKEAAAATVAFARERIEEETRNSRGTDFTKFRNKILSFVASAFPPHSKRS